MNTAIRFIPIHDCLSGCSSLSFASIQMAAVITWDEYSQQGK